MIVIFTRNTGTRLYIFTGNMEHDSIYLLGTQVQGCIYSLFGTQVQGGIHIFTIGIQVQDFILAELITHINTSTIAILKYYVKIYML